MSPLGWRDWIRLIPGFYLSGRICDTKGDMGDMFKSLLSGLCKREDSANRSEISNYVHAFNVVYVKRKDPSRIEGGLVTLQQMLLVFWQRYSYDNALPKLDVCVCSRLTAVRPG